MYNYSEQYLQFICSNMKFLKYLQTFHLFYVQCQLSHTPIINFGDPIASFGVL